MNYKDVYNAAVDKARMLNRDVLIMRNTFGEYSTAPATDTSDYAKYEIVRPSDPKTV